MKQKTALVLSAGGMFGAYQAGVCAALAPALQPDLYVGASIGSLNAWALAGGCTPQELGELWRNLKLKNQWHFPRAHLDGLLDARQLHELIQDLHQRFHPHAEIGVVVTDLLKLRPRLFRDKEITWQHLAASCAVPGVFPQQRLHGRVYSDGGLLGALPLWAAVEMGATRIVAVNALTQMPAPIRMGVNAVRAISSWRPAQSIEALMLLIAPRARLGTARDSLRWRRDNVERWIDEGRRDGELALAAWKQEQRQ
jgi:NTE family protein